MEALIDVRFVSLVIASPGLAIIGWASLTLLAWVGGREATLPFGQTLTDESRLVHVGVDISYGLFPLLVSFAVLLGTAGTGVPLSVFLLAEAGAVLYFALYHLYLRRRVVALRAGRRGRVLVKPSGR